jgi:hypothetical protein
MMRSSLAALLLVFCLTPSDAEAQFGRSMRSEPAIGENYRVEIAAAWWKPELFGSISSDSLELVGSRVDLVGDLGFGAARFRDLRVTIKPGRKHKIRFQYTPLEYAAEGQLARQITFAGSVFDVALPLKSEVGWKVWRIGYEWDVISHSRGFLGVLFEVRKTELTASLESVVVTGEVAAEAPLPAIGLVVRGYPLPDLGVHFEISGLKVPKIDNYEGNYTDIELSAIVNITNSLGVSGGWRRLNTNLRIDRDFGDLKFSGLWFGGAVRY